MPLGLGQTCVVPGWRVEAFTAIGHCLLGVISTYITLLDVSGGAQYVCTAL